MDISPDQALVELQRANEALRQLLDEQRAERDAALAREAALAEVMEVINRSPGDPQPVFQTILEKAHSLCGAAVGAVFTCDGEYFRAVATRGFPEQHDALVRRPFRPNTHHMELMRSGRPAHIPDLKVIAVSPDDEVVWNTVERTDVRTLLAVPLRKDGAVVGWISAFRNEVRLFSESEIALLENFAAQAVIAMENARLLDELRQRTQDLQESLEYQTATGDVLKVISQSDGELGAILDTLVETAARICRADSGFIFRFNDDLCRMVASFGNPAEYREFAARNPIALGRGTTAGRTVLERHVVQIEDAATDPEYTRVQALEMARQHTMLGVPLVREDSLIGVITLARSHVEAFTEKQIALVSTFADQAVIAIENARLLDELRERSIGLQEALDYQTAASDVLKEISRSVFDLNAVLHAVITSAVNLCRAERAILYRSRDGRCHFEVGYNNRAEYEERERKTPIAPSRETLVGRTMLEGRPVQVIDAWNDPEYGPKEEARLNNVHSMLGVPMLRDGELIGVFALARTVTEPYTERQIELVTTFADQAVIAIENARLLSELQARTEELAQRQAELRITFENMADGVALFGETTHLVAWNRKFQEMFDLPDALLDQHRTYDEYLRFLATRGDYGTGVDPEQQIRALVASVDKPHSYERTRPDGRVLEIRRNPVPSGGFVLIFSDITERKRNEAAIRAARDAAEAAYRELKTAQASLIQAEKMASLGQLTAGIAHEIKNPLNFVNNFADLSVELLNEAKATVAPVLPLLDADRRAEIDDVLTMVTGNLAKITEHGRRADAIVRSMLEHSRGGSGDRRRVDLNMLVEEALNLAYHGARARDQSFNITLQRDFAVGIAPIDVVPQDVTRVLLNLFGNGFYAARQRQRTEDGTGFEPILRVTTRDLAGAVEIKVHDNGTGIPPEIRDRLFQPFFTTKPTGEGTGLGLSISYDIVTQQYGGSITVESEPNSFTEFTITIPRVLTLASV